MISKFGSKLMVNNHRIQARICAYVFCALFNWSNYAIGAEAPQLDESAQQLQQLQALQAQQQQQLQQGAMPPWAAEVVPSTQPIQPIQPAQPAPQGAVQPAFPPTANMGATPAVVDNNVPAGANVQIDEQMQQLLQSSPQELIDEMAFRETTRNTFPITPEQIVRLREMYEELQLAEATSPKTPPRPTATSQHVSLAPGATPPVIRLSKGFVSSLVFLDSTGAEWPITAYDLGDPDSFNIQWDRTSNTLMIQAMELYTYGNLAVRLQGLTTPVMLTLTPGQQAVDYRVDLRIQGRGPNAKEMPTGDNLPSTADPLLLNVLDGIPPPESTELSITGGEAQAWEYDGKIFLRTRLNVLSPAWLATMSSADGMQVYEMSKAPIILASRRGSVVQLKVEGL
ncbi:MAG: DotH/IcmK family type IV secretion protein [Gammaproteobacteria bacterium]